MTVPPNIALKALIKGLTRIASIEGHYCLFLAGSAISGDVSHENFYGFEWTLKHSVGVFQCIGSGLIYSGEVSGCSMQCLSLSPNESSNYTMS